MKKRLRLFLVLSLALTMLFSLVGCAGAGTAASENEAVVEGDSAQTNDEGNTDSSEPILNYATPSPELSSDISSRNIQIGDKVFTSPFTLSDLADIYDDVVVKFSHYDEGPDFNPANGSRVDGGGTIYMEPMSTEDFNIWLYATRGDGAQYQRLFVTLDNTSNERIPVSEGIVAKIGTMNRESEENVFVDILMPGGISAYQSYPEETYVDAWGSAVENNLGGSDPNYRYSFAKERGDTRYANEIIDTFTVYYREDGTTLRNVSLQLIPFDLDEHNKLSSYLSMAL